MNTTTTQQHLPAAIDGKYNIPLLAEAARLVLVCGLYPAQINDLLTNARAKEFARQFIYEADHPYQGFAEFCQRILMARHWVDNHANYELPRYLGAWLHPCNRHGFAGTALWFERLQTHRKRNRLHKLEMKAFPEAILELAEDPSAENLNYWSSWFIEKQAPNEYLLMQAVGARLAFRNLPTYQQLD